MKVITVIVLLLPALILAEDSMEAERDCLDQDDDYSVDLLPSEEVGSFSCPLVPYY